MRNPSSSRFSAREHPRTPPLTTSGNAGTEMRLRRRSASGQSPISSPVRNMSATHPAPRPTKDHLDNNDVDVDVDSLPAIITSTIPGKRLWTEPAHKKTITVMVSSSLSHDEEGQHDSSTQPDGLCGDLSFENDDSESESEDAKSFHSSPPPRRYVSPPRRNDLATVLLAGPSHVDFNQHVAARLGDSLESHTSPHHAKVSRTSRYRPGPEEEDMDERQSLASSSRPDNVSGHLRQRVSSKRKSADVLVISARTRKAARYMRTPSSDSESSEDDEDEAMASGSEADASRPWTASDQQHVQNCLQSRAGRTVCLPTTPSARARRLLIPSDDRYPLITVYMRGDLQFIHQSRL